ncbi:MAG: aconitate hydratase [Armatimonadota bacterium]|nr:aconitate hydratase [Armatimonadota bacterium]MDR7470061.1 aconitate hydratase [Armatimonadota bacterium]MDR7474417.1 aconitate hydratase [Armatimonadota bacterium]
MSGSVSEKIIQAHLVEGELTPGREIALRVDQTLLQDATGTMAALEFEAMGVERVRTWPAVVYVDHNMLQVGFENADDHRFLRTFAARYGLLYSRPGNGICHQVHLQRFAVPGRVLLGADSHTTTAGALGMLAIGAGGLDVALAMAGEPYRLVMPVVVQVRLTGRLGPWVSGKDVILELLRRLSVKGGVGKIFEFCGQGLEHLDVYQRAAIANMIAELGATAAVFPSDAQTYRFLCAQRREGDWAPLEPDLDAVYQETIELDLGALEPLVAQPSSPDAVVPVSAVAGTPVAQVCIGSCQNSSYRDLRVTAEVLRGKTVHPAVSLTVTPGSLQVYQMAATDGTLAELARAGARILELACGPCIGMGQAPPSGAVSVRTFNRNFPGRSGTAQDRVFLASPEVAAAAALTGELTDPRRLGPPPQVREPEVYPVDDRQILRPPAEGQTVEIERGPNIKPVPIPEPLPASLRGPVLLKVGDNITTDHILPAGARVLPLRSNIPAISEFTFHRIDPDFPARAQAAREAGGGFVVGGSNYGQGSSREHAAIAPMYLGVRAVIAKSFARIHRSNLINFGILPLEFAREEDYARVQQGEMWEIPDVRARLARQDPLVLRHAATGEEIPLRTAFTPREVEILLGGGVLRMMRDKHPAPAA